MSMSEVDYSAREAQRATQHLILEAFRDAHDRVNSLGGAGGNDVDDAIRATVGKCLSILETIMDEVSGS